MKSMDCRVVDLYPDDVLYLPKGVLHVAEAITNTSAHVTFGLIGQRTCFDLAMAVCNRTLAAEDCQLLQRAWQRISSEPEAWSLQRQLPVWQLVDAESQAFLLAAYNAPFADPRSGLSTVLRAALQKEAKSYHDQAAIKRVMHGISQLPTAQASALTDLVSGELVSEEAKTYVQRLRRSTPFNPPCGATCLCSSW